VNQPFTVDDLGGWSTAYVDLIEGLWMAEIEPQVELRVGPSVVDLGE
jgi:hypothetical protein